MVGGTEEVRPNDVLSCCGEDKILTSLVVTFTVGILDITGLTLLVAVGVSTTAGRVTVHLSNALRQFGFCSSASSSN